MTTPAKLRQKAVELIDRLPKETLVEAIELLESLCLKANQVKELDTLISEEIALLEIIQHRLPPHAQKRLNHLREQNEWGELTETEYRELLAYEEQIEERNVKRLEASIALAKIRQIELTTLMAEFTSQESNSDV